MNLPIVINDTDQRWSCHQCGHCCRGSLVFLSEAEAEQLRQQRWDQDPVMRGVRIMVPTRSRTRPYRLAHRADGSCVLLGDDGLCRIHAKFGYDTKPTMCKVFPLQLIPQDKQVVLTTRRACPTAAADKGVDLKEHLPFIKQLLRDDKLRAEPIEAPWLKLGERRDWKTTKVVLQCAAQLLQDVRYPPVRRLVHVLQFANLLNKAKTRLLNDAKIAELARTLVEVAPEESKLFFEERREPKSYSKVMFRLMAMECARLHPLARHRPRWSARWMLTKIAWRAVLGRGQVPVVDPTYPPATFEQLEQPLGTLSPEIYLPLSRMLETTSASWMYALADRSDWSIVESLRALAILYPVGLWLLRWLAVDRAPTVDDMLLIIVALDRTQGHASLSGSAHRWRLSMLGAQEELERLVVWYGR